MESEPRHAPLSPAPSGCDREEAAAWDQFRQVGWRRIAGHDCTPLPARVHQLWLEPSSMPEAWAEATQQWAQWCAAHEWTYTLWTSASTEAFLREHFRWLLPVYRRSNPTQQSYVARYALLHHFGGMYVDVDWQLRQANEGRVAVWDSLVRSWREQFQLVLATSGDDASATLSTTWVLSAPQHPLWRHVLMGVMQAPWWIELGASCFPHVDTEVRLGYGLLQRTWAALRGESSSDTLVWPASWLHSDTSPWLERVPHRRNAFANQPWDTQLFHYLGQLWALRGTAALLLLVSTVILSGMVFWLRRQSSLVAATRAPFPTGAAPAPPTVPFRPMESTLLSTT